MRSVSKGTTNYESLRNTALKEQLVKALWFCSFRCGVFREIDFLSKYLPIDYLLILIVGVYLLAYSLCVSLNHPQDESRAQSADSL